MSSLTKILIDWEGLFHDINHKNNSVIKILGFSTLCGWVRTSFGDIVEKFTVDTTVIIKNVIAYTNDYKSVNFQVFQKKMKTTLAIRVFVKKRTKKSTTLL